MNATIFCSNKTVACSEYDSSQGWSFPVPNPLFEQSLLGFNLFSEASFPHIKPDDAENIHSCGKQRCFPIHSLTFSNKSSAVTNGIFFFILALPVRTWSVFAVLPVSVPPDPPPTILLTTVKSIYNTLQQVHRWTSLSVVPLLQNSYLLVLITSFMC